MTSHVKTGDKLYLTKAPDGYRINAYDADFVEYNGDRRASHARGP